MVKDIEKMKYCKLCLQNNLRPNIKFNKDGICPACTYQSKLKNIDWDYRLEFLKEFVKEKLKNNKSQFDCLIGVSGGKDSTRQALWVREKLKLKPLLVCFSYPPEQVSERGVDNISNLINLGFDVVVLSGGPNTWKKMMQEGFLKFSNWAKSTELALFSSVPRIAVNYKIPLIFWGENPSDQWGELKSRSNRGWNGNNIKNINTLKSGDMTWISRTKFKKDNLFIYKYPTKKEFLKNKLQIIYLGWFWKNWSLKSNAYYSIAYGLKIRDKKFINYGDIYGVSSLDEDWVTINQLIKYYKFGFGKASDYVNEDIRNKLISRKLGVKIIKKYDSKFSKKILKNFCDYIGISEKFFWYHIKKNLNRNIFKVYKGKIIPKFNVGTDYIN